jgi:hypothetical protein
MACITEAAARGTMVTFTFHGTGGEYLSVPTAAHEELLRHLADTRDAYRTDTFLNIMKYVKKRRARAQVPGR